MALHEIQIPHGYKINESFFNEKKFKKFLKENNLYYSEEDEFFLKNYLFYTNLYSSIYSKNALVLNNSYKLLEEEILKPIEYNLKKVDDVELYSTWFLFFIALGKSNDGKNEKENFIVHLNDFKFMEEYLLKKSYIDMSYLNDKNRKNLKYIKNELNNSLNKFIKTKYENVNKIIIFLKFLLKLHKIFFENEQYKIMWNLESVYIHKIIDILKNTFSLEYKDIITRLDYKMGIGISKIDSIYIELPKYINDNKKYIINKELTSKINHLFELNLKENELFSIIYKEEYFEIYNSIIELQKRCFSSSRIDISLCLSILIGLVLSLEPRIKELSGVDKSKQLLTHLKKSKKFNFTEKIVEDNCPKRGTEYFKALDFLYDRNETILIYLLLYRETRNYLAHANVDYFKLFYEDEYIKNIINSMLITIFFLIKKHDIN